VRMLIWPIVPEFNFLFSSSGMPEVERAKRTQFRPGGHGAGGGERLPASLRTGQIVRNEPNFPPGADGGHSPPYERSGEPLRRRLVQNEPNLAPPGRLTEEIVQNEAKLRGTGVCGQSQSSAGGWRPAAKRAKRTQFRPRARDGYRRANAQNKPNQGPGAQIADCGLEGMSGGDAQPTKRQNAQNKPNLAASDRGCRDGRCEVRKVLHAAL
jgi:hypothetical protein